MGGVEALARLRESEPRVVAIATTGYSEETLGEDLRALLQSSAAVDGRASGVRYIGASWSRVQPP